MDTDREYDFIFYKYEANIFKMYIPVNQKLPVFWITLDNSLSWGALNIFII